MSVKMPAQGSVCNRCVREQYKPIVESRLILENNDLNQSFLFFQIGVVQYGWVGFEWIGPVQSIHNG